MFAASHHRFQPRKGSHVPYLSHLLSVSALVLEHGGSEDAAIAGLLHDAVEDAPAGQGPGVLKYIGDRFGQHVAEIVRSCSDGLDAEGNRSGTWVERKVAYISALPNKSPDAALVTAADKIHNTRCITNDVRAYGQQFWSVFNACSHQLTWYYDSVLEGLEEQLRGTTIAPVLEEAVSSLIAASGLPRPAAAAQPPTGDCPGHANDGSY